LRARLLRETGERHLLLVSLHHLISDGLSLEILVRELDLCYSAFKTGFSPSLPVLPIQMKDYSVWQQDQLHRGSLADQRDYWLTKLGGELPVLDLPLDRSRPAHQDYAGGQAIAKIPAWRRDRLLEIGRDHGVTLFAILTAAVKVLLHNLTGQEDIIVGTPVAGRQQPDLQTQIGYYLNNVVLRDSVHRTEPFTRFLGRVSRTINEALANQDYPFDSLVEAVSPPVPPGHSPLFDVQVNLMPPAKSAMRLGDLIVGGAGEVNQTTLFDLNFMFSDGPLGLTLELAYAVALFHQETVEQFAEQLCQHLANLCEQPDISVRALCRGTNQGPRNTPATAAASGLAEGC
jgi:hypothetical protein